MKRTLVILLLTFVVSLFSVSIYDIQFTDDAGDGTYPSTYAGQVVTTTGIVTATNFDGYKDNIYISMPSSGAWTGLYLYNCGDTTLVAGDEIEVTGEIVEYWGLTELKEATSVTILSSGNEVPAPVQILTAEAAAGEAYEGVYVEVNNIVVTQSESEYGEWYATDASALPCKFDDEFFYLDSVDPPIVITAGQNWAIVRGIMTYSYSEYTINPVSPDDFISEVSSPSTEVVAIATLDGNYPNPFNPSTTVKYSMEESANVSIDIYNIKGKKVKTLVNDIQSAGSHTEVWNGSNDKGETVGSGIYFMKMRAGNVESTKKMVLMK